MIVWSAHLGTLFTEHPLLERFAAAQQAGFVWAECWSPFDEDLDRFAEAVSDSGLRLVGFNLDAGDMGSGERGFLNLPDRRPAVLDNADVALELADRLSVPAINCLVGNDSGEPREEQLAAVAETLAEIAGRAESHDVTLLVEALNPDENPAYLLRNPDEAARTIENVGHPQVRMLFDGYHAACAGRPINSDFKRHHAQVAHVQIADSPGRHEPGTGKIDFVSFFETVRSCGYAGAVGLEYHPSEDTLASLSWLPAAARGQSDAFTAFGQGYAE